jgi:hypothetical protein
MIQHFGWSLSLIFLGTGFDSTGKGDIKKLSNVKFIGSIMYIKNCFVWNI